MSPLHKPAQKHSCALPLWAEQRRRLIDKLSQASEINSIQKTLESQALLFFPVIKPVLSYQVSTLKLYEGSIKSVSL